MRSGTDRVEGGAPARMLAGTSGFDYPHWAGAFYPDDLPHHDRLAFYARRFRTVELNSTFYRLPDAASFDRWRDQVPDEFTFALKASRFLTHVRRLRDPAGPVETLMERAERLGGKLGPILLQLPPRMRPDPDRLEATIEAFGSGVRIAVEPRDPAWFNDEIRRVLDRHGAALCLADRRGPVTPQWRTAPWLYLRFHEGRARIRPSGYGRTSLRTWAERITHLAGQGATGYAYFNNDAGACAVADAATFERALERAGVPAAKSGRGESSA